jgi:hypothetical protein
MAALQNRQCCGHVAAPSLCDSGIDEELRIQPLYFASTPPPAAHSSGYNMEARGYYLAPANRFSKSIRAAGIIL